MKAVGDVRPSRADDREDRAQLLALDHLDEGEGESRGRKLCVYMANHIDDALDELVSQLLGCSAVLSQMISRMVEWESAGHSAPDAAPIPTVAHELIGSVLDEVKRRHSRRDLIVAASIVGEATNAMTENIFFVPLPEEGSSADDASGNGQGRDSRVVDGE